MYLKASTEQGGEIKLRAIEYTTKGMGRRDLRTYFRITML